MNDENRVLIFTTEVNITHLEHSEVLICDGTFKSAPSCFEQIFTIQCRLRDMYLPMMFCFMTHKNEISYNIIFQWIQSKNENILKHVKSIIIDFEIASFYSLKKFFKNSYLYGCCFHLGQIIWRKVQKLKFSSDLINNAPIKLQVKMILALSFVSLDKVKEYASKLRIYILQEGSMNVLSLFEWFEAEYLYGTAENKQICFWNAKIRTEQGIPRTTNSLEGYHRHLNTFINTKQSSIIPIINELKNEQAITENKLFLSLYKQPSVKSDPVKKLLKKYEILHPIDYLTYIA
ncbi:hypothetical protein DMUE_4967, partial [Dictyocoela muelleri]